MTWFLADVGDHLDVLRHALAPIVPRAAGQLCLPRTVDADGVVISFDDGPHPDGTPAVLETLARAHARAVFFVIGEQVERRPWLLREIADAGHVVALHGYRHRLQLRMGAREVEADLRKGAGVIADALHVTPQYHRPPYGIYSAAGLASARASGLKPLLWSRWGRDWRKFTTPERIASRVTRGIDKGDVILLHDADFYSSRGSHLRTVRALELILAELRAKEIATVLPI